MKSLMHILAATIVLLAVGCSKKDTAEKDASESSSESTKSSSESDKSSSEGDLPKISKVQPAKDGGQRSGTISRQADGLWREAGSREPFSGTVVHDLDDQRWEEKYKQGVRVSVRAWDKEEGNPVALHAWNADGSPRD